MYCCRANRAGWVKVILTVRQQHVTTVRKTIESCQMQRKHSMDPLSVEITLFTLMCFRKVAKQFYIRSWNNVTFSLFRHKPISTADHLRQRNSSQHIRNVQSSGKDICLPGMWRPPGVLSATECVVVVQNQTTKQFTGNFSILTATRIGHPQQDVRIWRRTS